MFFEVFGTMHWETLNRSSELKKNILQEGRRVLDQGRDETYSSLSSVPFHGPPGSGKTTLAASVARSNAKAS